MRYIKYLFGLTLILFVQNLPAQTNSISKKNTAKTLSTTNQNSLKINNKILSKYTSTNYRIELKYGSNGIISSMYLYDKNTDNIRDKYNGTNKRISIGFWEDGTLKERFSATGSKWEGEFVHYRKNGLLSEKSNYSDGLKNGEEITFFSNGKIQWKCNYKRGKRVGEAISYYDNGMLESKLFYNDQNSLEGEVINFYDNGKYKCTKNFNHNGNLEGQVTWFYKSGEILSKFVFNNGTQIGKAEYYNLKGEIVDINDINWNENNTPLISFSGNIMILNKD